jgi:hypothetical protein
VTYIADWFADCLAGCTPDGVLTLVGQDARISRTPFAQVARKKRSELLASRSAWQQLG